MAPPALEASFTVNVGVAPASFSVEVALSLGAPAGVLVLFGPSGAGKSLTLQALAGLLRPSQGFVRVGGEPLFDQEKRVDVPAEERRIGYVPQHQALFPFLDVAGNAAFGLPRRERDPKSARIKALLAELGIAHLAKARPGDLSGGERQRVALARALAVEPRLLLLDEPFAAVDQDGRASLRDVLRATLQRRQVPAVFVTHDADEAVEIGDTLVRFERGRTTASGTPRALLGRGEPVVVTGHAVGPASATAGEGRGEMGLRDVKVEGPLDVLTQGENAEVRLVLRTRG
jgi:molybdate transport system ATP-binding protein